MRGFVGTWVFIILLITGNISVVVSQNQTIAKTQVVEIIDAKKYYMHTVQAKETAYAIARTYAISYAELLQNNPGIEQGLAIGQILKIPYIEASQEKQDAVASPSKEVISVNNQDFIIHKVEQGQTVYSIARMYDIAPAKILEANPDYVESLPIGVQIIIPKPATKLVAARETPRVETKQVEPVVQKKQEEEPVQKAPTEPKNVVVESKKTAEPIAQTISAVAKKRQSIRIVLMLPFMLDINSKPQSETEIINKQIQIHPSTFPFVEYYEGVLLAVDSLRKKGITVNLDVYDSSKDSIDIQEILQKINTKNLDLIIGPVFPVSFSFAAEFAKKHKIPIVSPLSNEEIAVKTNPYVIQVNSPQRYRFKEIAGFASQYKQCNVIFVYNSIDLELAQVQECKRIFTQYYADSIKKNGIKLKEVYFPKLGLDGVEKAMHPDEKNVIIVMSRNQAFINNLVTKLFQFSKKYDVHLIGLPMWEKYDNLELDFLFALQFQFVTNGYVDYINAEVIQFISTYRNVYKTEPTKYSFQGYDQIMFFSQCIIDSGDAMMQCVTQTTKVGLHDRYAFVREQPTSGVVNTSVQTVFYTKTFEKLYK